MKTKLLMMLVCIMVLAVLTGYGQMMPRTDAVWARMATSPITLDGQLNEASWAAAESIRVQVGQDSGIPGGGWYWENGLKPGEDPTDATVKFLAQGDYLYIGVVCKDKSVGGGLFNHFDGFLMNIRYRAATGGVEPNPYRNRGDQANELFYGWVTEGWADTTTAAVGALPAFLGDWSSAYVHPRPDSLKDFWDAVTTVQGISNSDTTADTSWTTEVKINLTKFNYELLPSGEIAMFSMSIYDADYQWPLDTLKQAGNRVWIQSPWGNASAYNHLRVFISPEMTDASLGVMEIAPDYIIPDGKNFDAPTVNGMLDEPVWNFASSLQLQYGNADIRNEYANTAKYRSGQFQPDVNGGKAVILDPNLATMKYFFRDDALYLGFDVEDQFVQYVNILDQWDGFRITMDQRDARNGDSVLVVRRFTFRVDSIGGAIREEDLGLGGWDSLQNAVTVAVALKEGTTVDTLGASADVGYTAEMRIDLQEMGYPAGRGDGVAFLGVTHFDGDSFSPATSSYGSRVWFMRENDWPDGAAWFYMDPQSVVSVEEQAGVPDQFALLGNYPNPFNPSTTVKFTIPRTSDVTMDVYDVLGRLVSSKALGVRPAGIHTATFDATNLASGTYYYRLKMVSTGATLVGKMMLLK